MDRLKIKQAVIVEGRYDRAVLESVIDTVIIPVNGFGVYKDKKRLSLIKRYAETIGIVIMTDSDNAGRQIRDFIKNYLHRGGAGRGCEVYDVYVPGYSPGNCSSPEVEDTAVDVLRNVFEKFSTPCRNDTPLQTGGQKCVKITRQRLFDDGLIGGKDSAKKRKALLRFMNLPENLSVTSLLEMLNRCGSDDYETALLGTVPYQ